MTYLLLYQRIAQQLAEDIRRGVYRPGERVPSVRKMSRQLSVSHATVLQAYANLEDQGMIRARPQSGLYVHQTPVLTAPTPEAQRVVFDRESAPLVDARIVQFLARRRASLFGLGIPPAQYDKLAADGGGDIIAVLRERTRKLFCDFPISDNYFAWQAANRGYAPSGAGPVPPYLEARHFDTIRANAPRVTVVNRSVTDLLADMPRASQDVCILLDAQDWMNDAQLGALWAEITRTAAPGARVLFRTGGTADILPGRLPADLLGRWRYDAHASARATAADRSAIYGAVHLYRFEG